MTRSQASLVVSYLNQIYTGPVDGIFSGSSAFTDKRTCEVDSNGFWVYYVTSPFGVYRDGIPISFNEEQRAIHDAKCALGIA